MPWVCADPSCDWEGETVADASDHDLLPYHASMWTE